MGHMLTIAELDHFVREQAPTPLCMALRRRATSQRGDFRALRTINFDGTPWPRLIFKHFQPFAPVALGPRDDGSPTHLEVRGHSDDSCAAIQFQQRQRTVMPPGGQVPLADQGFQVGTIIWCESDMVFFHELIIALAKIFDKKA